MSDATGIILIFIYYPLSKNSCPKEYIMCKSDQEMGKRQISRLKVGILFIHSRIANLVTPKLHCLVLFLQFTFTMLTMGKKGKKY
jgi:hypothetical protein